MYWPVTAWLIGRLIKYGAGIMDISESQMLQTAIQSTILKAFGMIYASQEKKVWLPWDNLFFMNTATLVIKLPSFES